MKNIMSLIREIREIEKGYLKELREEVNYIKNNNVSDLKYIESTLDNIMSISFLDTHSLFYELCNYYDNIDEECSNEYRLMYKEINKND